MGQTLTHGIYLPDEGERNCYNGLAGNWQLLDGAVGTVAEHTSALSGKAPLVHTHTKSDITDFPAYGNAAGTICEGNASRLSDARTPVAHTHGKSDITDLFNSANTWSANNTYSADCIIYNSDNSGSVATLKLRNSKAEVRSTGNTSSDQSMTFRDKNDVAISYIKGAVQSNGAVLKIGAYAKDSNNNTVNTELQLLAYSNGNKAIFPSTTNTYDLGSSSYQWNNLYAKNYYYNGTAWGLDKANTWTGNNTFTGRTSYVGIYDKFQTTAFDVRTDPESTRGGDIFRFWSGTGSTYGDYLGGMSFYQSTDGSLTMQLICFGYPQTGNSTQNRINFHSARDGTSAFYPVQNNNINLGTSTNKWKTLNGINPGALCFPEGTTGNANTTFNPDLTNWLTDGTGFTITAQVTGWLHIRIQNSTGNFAWVKRASAGSNQTWGIVGNSDTNSDIADIPLNVPVVQGYVYTLKLKTSRLSAAIFMCLGNV